MKTYKEFMETVTSTGGAGAKKPYDLGPLKGRKAVASTDKEGVKRVIAQNKKAKEDAKKIKGIVISK